jgi:FMN reductase
VSVVTVVGNPKPRSRTFEAASLVAERLTGKPPNTEIDLADLGAGLLDWSSAEVTAAADVVRAADLVVFASPTYKATYTGLIKLFLERFGAGELAGVTGVPVMLGGSWKHSLAPDLLFKPVLIEIGVTCPTAGLYLLDSTFREPDALDGWLRLAAPAVQATSGRLR